MRPLSIIETRNCYSRGGCGVIMAKGESVETAFTTIRIRRFDHDRLMSLRRARETHWEVVRRLLDEKDLREVSDDGQEGKQNSSTN